MYDITATVKDNGSPMLSGDCDPLPITVVEATECVGGILVLGLRTTFPASSVADGETFSLVAEADNTKPNKNYVQIGIDTASCTRTGSSINCGSTFNTPGPGVYFTNAYISGSDIVVEFEVDGTQFVPVHGSGFVNKLPPDTRFIASLGSSAGVQTNEQVIHTSCSQPIGACPPNTPPDACVFGEFQIIKLIPKGS
jgi:hypothetical protein